MFHFSQSLRLNPDNPIVLNGIGVALYEKGDIRGALDFFQKGLETHPNDAQLRYNFEKVSEIQKRGSD
jgi:lipoprotein NlpI